jgi:hypothetical protein
MLSIDIGNLAPYGSAASQLALLAALETPTAAVGDRELPAGQTSITAQFLEPETKRFP